MSYINDGHRTILSRHELRLVTEDLSQKTSIWSLQAPGTREYSALISFTPEGMAITGDIRIKSNGVHSAPGSGCTLAWFRGHLNEDYLIEKFDLDSTWDQERAWWDLVDIIKQLDIHDDAHMLRQLVPIAGDLASVTVDHDTFLKRIEMTGYEDTDRSLPGWGVAVTQAGWLCAIQWKFKELWDRRKGTRDYTKPSVVVQQDSEAHQALIDAGYSDGKVWVYGSVSVVQMNW